MYWMFVYSLEMQNVCVGVVKVKCYLLTFKYLFSSKQKEQKKML